MELFDFLKVNWVNLGLILVGLSAVWIYKMQEKGKLRDAACMIVLQINELQKRVQEIQSYITNQGLNLTAFYESLPLIDVNYWNNYKHLFVRKIDNKSYDSINKFYQYVTSMQEQQELLRNLQRNYFYVKQNAICNVEISFIIETLKEVDCSSVSSNQLQSFFQEVSTASAEKQSEIFTNLVKQIEQNNPDIDMGRFWSIYQSKRKRFISITNGDSLTPYTPEQISSTLQSLLKQYVLLEIAGIEGYRTLCKIAKMINK